MQTNRQKCDGILRCVTQLQKRQQGPFEAELQYCSTDDKSCAILIEPTYTRAWPHTTNKNVQHSKNTFKHVQTRLKRVQSLQMRVFLYDDIVKFLYNLFLA